MQFGLYGEFPFEFGGHEEDPLAVEHDALLSALEPALDPTESTIHEIETYNQLIPGPRQLSATILIEIEEKEIRERFLIDAKGLESQFGPRFHLSGGPVICRGKIDPSREDPSRTTAVHYVMFELTEAADRLIREAEASNVRQ